MLIDLIWEYDMKSYRPGSIIINKNPALIDRMFVG